MAVTPQQASAVQKQTFVAVDALGQVVMGARSDLLVLKELNNDVGNALTEEELTTAKQRRSNHLAGIISSITAFQTLAANVADALDNAGPIIGEILEETPPVPDTDKAAQPD